MGKRSRKTWSGLSPRSRAAIVALGFAEVVVTGVALRDLVRRPADLVRGPKALWAPILFVQPVGSPLYLLAGRRAVAS
ncbi:MAG TPA: PLDc N-terminal domain-containing protein [Gaiella sp.]|nr:PLDc N-terminal domain-containing protein [Gaiella sp.]